MSAMPECNRLIASFRAQSNVGEAIGCAHEAINALRAALLAAEARVREMEEQASRPVPLDYGRHPITDARRDFIHHALTYPGFVGNRDLFVEAARDLAAEAATLRAERDALVPVARLGLWTLDVLAKGKDGVIWNTIDFDGGDVELAAWGFNVLEGVPLNPEKGEWPQTSGETAATTQARAILAREET